MRLTLSRYFNNGVVTFGILKVDQENHQPIYTLESPDKDNQPNISCIPVGNYTCKPYDSLKHSDVYEVCDVPGRTHILIHIGNYPKDTKGCILPGMGVEPSTPMVTNSRPAIHRLRYMIGKKEFELEIKEI